MHLDPTSPRFHIEQTIDGTRIDVPARRNGFALAFLLVWLTAWAFAEVQVIGDLREPAPDADSAFMYFWLAGWTLGGLFALFNILWQLCGREVLTVGNGGLIYRVQLLGAGRNRSYALQHISGMRAVEFVSNFFTNQAGMKPPFFGATVGPIAFDYGAETVRIMPSMTEAEARILITKLKGGLPASVFREN